MRETVKLMAAADINPKGPYPGEISPETLCDFVPMSAVGEDGDMHVDAKRPYREVSKGYTPFRSDDVLVAKITPCFENGKIALAKTSTPFAFGSTEFHVIRCREAKLNPKYLLHFLRQDRIRHEGETRMTGSAGQKRVPKQFLEGLELPIHSMLEQRQIAAILDKADAIRRKREQALALADDFLKSIFVTMFGAPDRSDVCEELGRHLEFVTSGSRGWAQYYSESGARFIRSLDVQMNEISDEEVVYVSPPPSAEADRARVRFGDVLLTITGSRIGRVTDVTELEGDAYISQHVAIIRTKKTLLPSFLSFFLSSDSLGQRQIEKLQYGQTKPGLNLQQIRSFALPVPPMEQQLRFTRILAAIRGHKSTSRRQYAQATDLFASLSQRAFRGEL